MIGFAAGLGALEGTRVSGTSISCSSSEEDRDDEDEEEDGEGGDGDEGEGEGDTVLERGDSWGGVGEREGDAVGGAIFAFSGAGVMSEVVMGARACGVVNEEVTTEDRRPFGECLTSRVLAGTPSAFVSGPPLTQN